MTSMKPRWWQILLSVLAAGFGVQSEKARERDFEGGHPLIYLVVGILMTALLVLGLFYLAHSVSSA